LNLKIIIDLKMLGINPTYYNENCNTCYSMYYLNSSLLILIATDHSGGAIIAGMRESANGF